MKDLHPNSANNAVSHFFWIGDINYQNKEFFDNSKEFEVAFNKAREEGRQFTWNIPS